MPSGVGVVVVVVPQDALRVAVGIVVLVVPKGPEKRDKSQEPETQRRGYENGEDRHLSLNALSDTQIDEADMASAAMIGVAWPDSATGIATAL